MDFGYDFCGYVTRNDVRCTDGRVIRHNAFVGNDGAIVPLVWNHRHDEPYNVLGRVLLENRSDGVYGYGQFNDTEQGGNARLLVEHGDVSALSIYANQLKQNGSDVNHGNIREVSLVLAGANPKAFIESVLSHGDGTDEESIFYFGEPLELAHADDDNASASEKKDVESKETVQDVFDTLTDKQKKVVYALIGAAIENATDENNNSDKGDDEEMKHNAFDQNNNPDVKVLSHADCKRIFERGQQLGSLRTAIQEFVGDGILAHSIDTTGMEAATGTQTYGVNDASMLFPDPRNLNNPPEFIGRQNEWVATVIRGVKRTPFSRIKSLFADITEDAARAKGYIKGNQKKSEVFTTLKRTTTPTTIYKFQKMDRDDVIDITDFDVVSWIRREMRMMLDEEIARAILLGDGREADAEDKIDPSHIRPIATDVPLFNVKVLVSTEHGATNAEKTKATLDSIVRARKQYKGSGNPTFFTTEDFISECLLLEDGIGHKLYKSVAEVASMIRARDIVAVEPMEGFKVDGKNLIGVYVNLSDYNVGADKGGEVNNFDDFDIEYNKYRYLIETRCSGALVKPFSALTILDNEAAA